VIGETAIISDQCLIYQGVTLGGTGKETGKRHPTLGYNVTVGAGSESTRKYYHWQSRSCGCRAVVLTDVPCHSTVVGVPGRIIPHSNSKSTLEEIPSSLSAS
jgi:serine O-acetyltransferase